MKIIASILILLFTCNLIFAHTCATYSHLSDKEHFQKLQKTNAIFYGEVISISERMKNQDEFKYGSQIVKVKVLRAWKGIETNEITLLYTRAYTTFEEEIGGIGIKKVFYAYKREDDSNLHIDFCSFTLFDDERMRREFGEGKVFEQPEIEQSLQIQQTENNDGFWAGIWKSLISFFS